MRKRWNMWPFTAKLAGVLGIGAVIFAIWAYSPSLYNRQVSEPFPTAAPAATDIPAATVAPAPTSAPASTSAPAAIAEPAATDIPAATVAPAPTNAPAATALLAPTVAEPASPAILAKGSFVAGSTAGDQAEGTATIYTLADGKRVLRLENFRTSNGPDLVAALHTGANPETDDGSYFTLEGIKGNQGDQNYELPADLDVSKYRSVVIWCRTFNIVFGYATLAG